MSARVEKLAVAKTPPQPGFANITPLLPWTYSTGHGGFLLRDSKNSLAFLLCS